MAYHPVNPGENVGTSNGNVLITVQLDRPLNEDQTLVLLRTVPEFTGDLTKTPITLTNPVPVPDTPLTYTFESTGASLFGDDMEGLDEDTEIIFIPQVLNADGTVATAGTAFSMSVYPYVLPEPPIDLPWTDNLMYLWDARFRVNMGTNDVGGHWDDRVSHERINFNDRTVNRTLILEDRTSGEELTTRFRVNHLRVTNVSSGDAVGRLVDPLALPPTWTMFVIGYTNHQSNYEDTAIGDRADELFGYQSTNGLGPYEGVYKTIAYGTVASSGQLNVNADMSQMRDYTIRSHPSAGIVEAFVEGEYLGGIAFDTSSIDSKLSTLFPDNPWGNTNYQLGLIGIYSSLLTDDQVEDLHDYARRVWYRGET
jgi:hypothetical protein